jgi:hypothetical protein
MTKWTKGVTEKESKISCGLGSPGQRALKKWCTLAQIWLENCHQAHAPNGWLLFLDLKPSDDGQWLVNLAHCWPIFLKHRIKRIRWIWIAIIIFKTSNIGYSKCRWRHSWEWSKWNWGKIGITPYWHTMFSSNLHLPLGLLQTLLRLKKSMSEILVLIIPMWIRPFCSGCQHVWDSYKNPSHQRGPGQLEATQKAPNHRIQAQL